MAVMTLGATVHAAVGDKFTIGNLKCQVLDEEAKTASVVGYAGEPSVVDIPETANGFSVVSIGSHAFENCSSLTSVTIPESVTKIGAYAFVDCSSLTSVEIPESVTEIGNHAFDYCIALTSVNIPNSVTKIGDYTFADCSMTSVIIPESITEIGHHAFDCCDRLTTLTLGKSVSKIGDMAFSECYELASIYCYATNPPTLGSRAFYDVETSDVTLHVLDGAVAVYKDADVWKDFSIVGDLKAEVGIEGIETDICDAAAEYFTLGGVRISGSALTPGLYLKRQGTKATKVLVR